MKTALSLVHDLQALLSGSGRWAQCVMATDAAGKRCRLDDSRARRWCLYSAMSRLVNSSWEFSKLRTLAERAGVTGSMMHWNDEKQRTFADIQALMAKMEELAREEAA